ncbi:MAG: radical SAM protein [Cyclobacteriaceae bacterium]
MPREIEVKSVLNKTKRRDPWFLDEYTFNPYSSCSFNCLYCYIRGSKYGINLEQSLSVKTNAIEILDRQLANRAKKNQYGIIVVSSATDPYLQVEKKYELTRRALEVILKHKFPVHIITKSDLVQRDFDLIHRINEEAILPNDLKESLRRGAIVTFSFSTLDDKVARIFEPGATRPSKRFETLNTTIQEGFLSGVSMMPLLPFISDTSSNLDHMFSSFKGIDAHYVLPATIALYGNQSSDGKALVLKAIQKHYPELLDRYRSYFSTNDEMPQYYQKAFSKKMNELSRDFGIRSSIINKAIAV